MADEKNKDPSQFENVDEEVQLESDGVESSESSQDLRSKTDAKKYESTENENENFDNLSNVHYGAEKINATTPAGGLGPQASYGAEEETDENVDYMMKALWHGAYFPKEKRTKFSERWRSNLDINASGKPETKKPLLTEFTSAGVSTI